MPQTNFPANRPSGRADARITARLGWLTACLLGALALQWVGLRVAASVMGVESMGRRAIAVAVPPVRLVARDLPTATAAAAPNPAAEPPRPESLTPTRNVANTAPAPAGTPTPPAIARPDAFAEAPPDGAATAYRFYGAKEVDVTAEPVSQWNLDPADLDALAAPRIVFTLFVGSNGSVLHCSVDEPERLSPDARKALEARLSLTEMRPARRAGLAVPSRRRVELFTVGGV